MQKTNMPLIKGNVREVQREHRKGRFLSKINTQIRVTEGHSREMTYKDTVHRVRNKKGSLGKCK